MARRLSDDQAEQLKALHAAAAICSGFARGPGDTSLSVCRPEVLAVLRRQGLTDRRVRRTTKGGRVSIYWLTPAGVLAARRLLEA